jgi:hypothetical protein
MFIRSITDDSEIVYKRLVLETGVNRRRTPLKEVQHNKVNSKLISHRRNAIILSIQYKMNVQIHTVCIK